MLGTHQLREGVVYNTSLLFSTEEQKDYKISGHKEGILSLYLHQGQFDGWNWDGEELSKDEIQEILDLFEGEDDE